MGEAGTSGLKGPELIRDTLRHLPASPGVYRMLDGEGNVLYVGKARSLKARVASYTRLSGHSNRIARMIVATRAMEFITTETDSEALLLEANLIKRYKPYFNVLLRDDKSFPYILLSRDPERASRLMKHRGARRGAGDYYGPFASAGAVNNTLRILQRVFLLRSCTNAVYDGRSRPCLLYQIKRCAAPCTGEISLADHEKLVAQARDFLSGKSRAIKADMVAKMEEASARLDFERAAIFRDRLAALSQIQAHQGVNPKGVREADVFAVHAEGGQVCIQVFFFRANQNWGNHAYFPRADKALSEAEVLQAFLSQFYDGKPCPKLILLSHEIDEAGLIGEALSLRNERRVRVLTPKRGEKRELATHALRNAREALARKLAASASQRHLLQEVQKLFDLERLPRRIEVYDNSHIQGTHAIGAMVVAGPEGLDKKQYRTFNIKSDTLAPGDDFAMMHEVLTRRFRRLQTEAGESVSPEVDEDDGRTATWPDLVIIDGGQGQLSAARGVMDELGLTDIVLVGIAKGPERNAGRERFFMIDRQPFSLEPRDPVLYFLQRLRDEAHRFAIGTHRARRKKALGRSALDRAPGIGPARKRALLRHFGSARAVSDASVADLKTVAGISDHLARSLYDFFHDGDR